MSHNHYDNERFFEKYSQMSRSIDGLAGAGEWPQLQKMLPCFAGKRVLDLGCGFGWHCAYALDRGAREVIGIDLSHRMLAHARESIQSDRVTFLEMSIEDYDYPPDSFDVVLSSLVFHYIENWDALLFKIVRTLKPGGDLIFSCEHPIFTAYGNQDWIYQADGSILCWPVDRYFESGARDAIFLGETIVKYHRTLTDYLRPLFASGLVLTSLIEPTPVSDRLEEPGMRDELRRPMMLLLSAHKPLASSQEG